MNDPRLNPCKNCRRNHLDGQLHIYSMTECDEDNDGSYYPARVHCDWCNQDVKGDKTTQSAIDNWNKKNPKR
jgi:hypothetical protein